MSGRCVDKGDGETEKAETVSIALRRINRGCLRSTWTFLEAGDTKTVKHRPSVFFVDFPINLYSF